MQLMRLLQKLLPLKISIWNHWEWIIKTYNCSGWMIKSTPRLNLWGWVGYLRRSVYTQFGSEIFQDTFIVIMKKGSLISYFI